MMHTKPYDVAEILHSEADIEDYLNAVLESGANIDTIKKALADTKRAKAKLESESRVNGCKNTGFGKPNLP